MKNISVPGIVSNGVFIIVLMKLTFHQHSPQPGSKLLSLFDLLTYSVIIMIAVIYNQNHMKVHFGVQISHRNQNI